MLVGQLFARAARIDPRQHAQPLRVRDGNDLAEQVALAEPAAHPMTRNLRAVKRYDAAAIDAKSGRVISLDLAHQGGGVDVRLVPFTQIDEQYAVGLFPPGLQATPSAS